MAIDQRHHQRSIVKLAAIAGGAIWLSGCSILGGGDSATVGDAPRPAFASPNLANQANGAGTPDPSAFTQEVDVTINAADTSACAPLTLKRDQRIAVRLPADPDSKLTWQLDDRPDGLRLLSPPRAENASEDDHTDQPLVFDWRFTADGASTGTLRLVYHDADAQQKAPEQVFECPIRIQ
ncbi:hypothetical protein R84981_002129 [Carnimonas sp. R-84981]|uniref:protease inhibitor I42 family protein n=1 Tax=Carnimonas bestiolae TaxID=3402172 RepID=UPI003EDB9B53